MVDAAHGAPKLYNVGSIISVYREDPATGEALLELTEYGDYATENITAKFPRAFTQARLFSFGKAPEDLEIYEGDQGGVEIDVPQAAVYNAVWLKGEASGAKP